jgi:type IV pilus assembly protein PilQ
MAAMRTVLLATGSLLLSLVATGSAPAQIVGEGRPTPGQIDVGATITLDVNDRPLEDVLDHVRNKVGVTIVTPPGTDGRVTIKLRDTPWQEALQLVAESAQCICTQVTPKLWRVEKPPRCTMSFQGEDIKKVIEAIAKYGSANIVVSEKVKGNVTMVVNDRPWRDALEAVVKTNGYFLVQEDRGILRVVDQQGLDMQVERRLFPLRYLRPKGTYVAKIETTYIEDRPSQKQAAGGSGQSQAEQVKKRFPLLEALDKMKSKSGEIDYLEDQNAILVLDTKPVIDEIGKFLERLDVEPVQIHIDVRFVTTTTTNDRNVALGFDKGLSASISGASRTSRFPFNLGPGSFAANLLPGRTSDNDNAFLPPGAASDFFGNTNSPVTPGTLDFSATSFAIRLVKEDQTAEVVQAPTLTTVDHREATIFVGEQVRYAQAEAASSQSGGLQLTVKEAANSPVDTGFQLLVIPHVVPGTNRILMTVIPQARSLTGTSDPHLPGFDLFTVGAGAVGSGSIELPRIGSQTIVTNMMLENGQTGIIGGLVQHTTSHDEHKTPFLSDIPWLGNLFTSHDDHEDDRKLLVFITPWIIGTSEGTDNHLKHVIEKYQDASGHEWDELAGSQS